MAQTDTTSDLSNKDKLDKDAQALAAEILRRDKSGRIKSVKVKIKEKVKTEEASEAGKEDKESGGESEEEPEETKQPEEEGKAKEKPGEEKKPEDNKKDESEKKGDQEPGQKPEADEEPEKKGKDDKNKKGEEKPEEKQPGGESGEPRGEDQGKSGKGGEKPSWQAGGRTKESDDFDSRLLNRDEEAGAADELRQQKMGAMGQMALNMVDSSGQEQKLGETGSLKDWAGAVRQSMSIKRQAQALKEKAKGKVEEAVAAPINRATSKLLQQAWINLLDSWGLTLIWVNIHVFLRWTLGDKLFCKLGEEWLPKQVMEAGGAAGKTANKGIGLLEVIVLSILDFIVLAVIFGILALIFMIVYFLGLSLWGQLKAFWSTIDELGWGGVSAFYDLFSSIK
ncbi:MAG: hypothetical protein PHS62_03770 [Patescibacteria group bacterium]|nr:hypothetical protein [Patescibacteria group bacterium]